MNILEPIRRQAEQQPDRIALISAQRELSYRDLMTTVRQMAAALHAAGVRRHDPVGIEVHGAAAHVVLTLAVAHLGAISVALVGGERGPANNPALAAQCGLAFVVHDRDAAQAPAYPGLKASLALRDLQSRADAPSLEQAQVEPGDTFRIAFSSGTTGAPKGIIFSHGASMLKTHLMRVLFPTDLAERAMIRMGIGQSFGMNYCLRALTCGAACFLSASGDAAQANAMIRKHRITQLVTTPAMALGLLADARRAGSPHADPAPHLALMAVGGAAMSQRLVSELKRHICPGLYINYGSSETGMVALAGPALQEADPACAGQVVPWVEAQAVDAAGAPLACGQTGPLRFRSPLLATGYVGPAQEQEHEQGAPAAVFRDGWFYSSDLGRVEADGRVYLAGRADNVLNIGGKKIDPERIEAVLHQQPAVVECAVVALKDAQGRSLLAAAVVTSGKPAVTDLKEKCGAALGRSHIPKLILPMKELPRNESGKVIREAVRARLQARLDAAASGRNSAADPDLAQGAGDGLDVGGADQPGSLVAVKKQDQGGP